MVKEGSPAHRQGFFHTKNPAINDGISVIFQENIILHL